MWQEFFLALKFQSAFPPICSPCECLNAANSYALISIAVQLEYKLCFLCEVSVGWCIEMYSMQSPGQTHEGGLPAAVHGPRV